MLRLTREVRFSVDRDWAGHLEFTRPVTNSWAGWPSAVGLVPYLRLRATVEGQPDAVTGYLCNIRTIDDLVRRHAIPRAAEALRDFGWRLAAEQLLRAVWQSLAARDAAPGPTLVALELLPTPTLRYSIHREDSAMVLMTQQFEFSASHRLHAPALSSDENQQIFGKCNNPNGHGHNYIVEVTVAGRPDERSGAVLPLPQFEQTVKERVIDVLDHKHLNRDTEAFARLNPTVENIARTIWEMLVGHVAPARLHCVRVYETPKTWAEFNGDGP
jgi:6-pyruvoyltetrahydropterin/6-carboxytetrahydropterin synthase